MPGAAIWVSICRPARFLSASTVLPGATGGVSAWSAVNGEATPLASSRPDLLASRLAREALLPAASVRRVSVHLHKCSMGEAVSEKVRPEMRPTRQARGGRSRYFQLTLAGFGLYTVGHKSPSSLASTIPGHPNAGTPN
jgi:hypothetical protein